jgi:hypothetical protein
MKINDVIVETEQLDELTAAQAAAAVGKGAGAVAKGVGAVAGGVAGAGKAFMKGFRGGKATVAGDDSSSNSNATRTSNTAAGSETPAAIQKQIQQKELEIKGLQNRLKAAATPQASTQAPTKTTQSPQANPVAQGATAADRLAKGQADQQLAIKQMKSTADANAAASAERSEIEKAGKAAAAKPGFQRTLADKNAIKTAQLKGIKVEAIKLDISNFAKGNKESGVFAANKIMEIATENVDIGAGHRLLTQSVYFAITKMLREHNLSWSNLGIRVHLLEGTNKLIGISFK